MISRRAAAALGRRVPFAEQVGQREEAHRRVVALEEPAQGRARTDRARADGLFAIRGHAPSPGDGRGGRCARPRALSLLPAPLALAHALRNCRGACGQGQGEDEVDPGGGCARRSRQRRRRHAGVSRRPGAVPGPVRTALRGDLQVRRTAARPPGGRRRVGRGVSAGVRGSRPLRLELRRRAALAVRYRSEHHAPFAAHRAAAAPGAGATAGRAGRRARRRSRPPRLAGDEAAARPRPRRATSRRARGPAPGGLGRPHLRRGRPGARRAGRHRALAAAPGSRSDEPGAGDGRSGRLVTGGVTCLRHAHAGAQGGRREERTFRGRHRSDPRVRQRVPRP